MTRFDMDEPLWEERYRPRTIEDVIIPKDMIDSFKQQVSKGNLANLLLNSNSPGTGKTSLTTALINDISADVKWINGSKDNGIDDMRNTVVNFASSMSIEGNPKIIVVDESDGLSPNAQASLRGIIEEFSKTVSFIFTCNYREKLIEPLLDRLTEYNFDNITTKHKKELMVASVKRLEFILKNEKIVYDKKDAITIVKNLYPSIRKMTKILQKQSISGTLSIDNVIMETNAMYKTTMVQIKDKDFTKMRLHILEMHDVSSIYTYFFKNIDELVEKTSQPDAIILCAKYMDMDFRARDKSITTMAFCTELMAHPKIKFL